MQATWDSYSRIVTYFLLNFPSKLVNNFLKLFRQTIKKILRLTRLSIYFCELIQIRNMIIFLQTSVAGSDSFAGSVSRLYLTVQRVRRNGRMPQQGRTVQRMPVSVTNLRGLFTIVSSTHMTTKHWRCVHMHGL